jgi:hypothetical protein
MNPQLLKTVLVATGMVDPAALIIDDLVASGKVAPTKQERGFRLVQRDPQGIRAINTIIPLSNKPDMTEQMKRDIEDAVMYYMGVKLTWRHDSEDYWQASSPEAAHDALVRAKPDVLAPKKDGKYGR